MLCDVVLRHRRRWAHAPVIHVGSRFDAWDPTRLYAFYNYGAPLGGLSGRRSSAIIEEQLYTRALS